MIRSIINIALQYFRTTFRSRNVVLFTLLMPIIFTFVLGTTIDGGDDGNVRWRLAVINEDASALSTALIERLQTSPDLDVSLAECEAALNQTNEDKVVAALVIPDGFGQALTDGTAPQVQLYTSATQTRSAQSVEQAIRAAVSDLVGAYEAAALANNIIAHIDPSSPASNGPSSEVVARASQMWDEAAPVVVQASVLTRLAEANPTPNGFDQSSPGMLVTFALVLMLNGAAVIILEREQGTLRRLLVMPVHKGSILSGKLVAIFVAGLAQAAILILVGQYAFGVNWGQSPLALVVLLVTFGFSITSLGMMIAGVARTYVQANALGNILMYSIAALGGAWWPIEITPQWMQQIAKLVPTYWAMQGFNDIISRGLGLAAIWQEAAILCGFGAIFLGIGVWRFRYE